jgi:DNA/RNA endonuclease YhcR with UshA esterase domain
MVCIPGIEFNNVKEAPMSYHPSTRAGRIARALLALGLLALALALAPLPASYAAPSAPPLISIAAARALPLGSTVTVQGAVTVPAGAFGSGTFDQGFAIQDETGGIYVSIAANLGLAPRRMARVTGQLFDSFGLLTLVPAGPSGVKALGVGPTVAPQQLTTSAIGEASEGLLVAVVGTITEPVGNDLPYGYRVILDDGSGAVQVFVYASTGIDVSGLAVGQRVRVVGFSSQFDTHYEINPRMPGDISPA